MIFLTLIFIFGIQSVSNSDLDTICNSKYTMLDVADRNIEIITQNLRCDAGISRGWYAFGKNRRLPTTCPKTGACSADPPLWTKSSQPNEQSPGPVTLNLCQSFSSNGVNFCEINCKLEIIAIYCSNIDMLLYELKPVNSCNIRYCYEEKIPCPSDQSSLTGYQPCEVNFPFNLLPNGTTTYALALSDPLFETIPGISLKCSIKCPEELDCSSLSGNVAWYVTNSVLIQYNTELLYDNEKRELYSYLRENQWSTNINSIYYCQIKPTLNGLMPSQNLFTSPYYAGLYLRVTDTNNNVQVYRYDTKNEIRILLTEASGKFAKLDVFTSLPILCNFDKKCSISITVAQETKFDILRISGCNPACDGCKRELQNQTIPDSSIFVSWPIYPTVETKNFPKSLTMRLSLVVRSNDGVDGTFWNNLLLPEIHIDYVSQNLGLPCAQSYNDPRIKTHDGTYFSFQYDKAEYLMMENNSTSLRIHAISKKCKESTTTGYCNQYVYIQSIDDFVYYNVDKPNILYYVNLKPTTRPVVQLPFDKNGDAIIANKPNSIKVQSTTNLFTVITHYATTIEIYKKSCDFNVYPSKYDRNQIRGVLGDYNGENDDDFIVNGVNYTNNLAGFLALYKVSSPGRPLFASQKYYPYTQNNMVMEYCICTNNTIFGGTTGFECPLGLLSTNKPNYACYLSSCKTKANRRNLPPFKMIPLEDLTKKIQVLEPYKKIKKSVYLERLEAASKRNANQSSCVSVLNISIARECDKLDLIDLDQMINNCEDDFELTGEDVWAESYKEYIIDVCRTKLTDDINNYVTVENSSVPVPQVEMLVKLCPNNCNNNGKCIEDGTCSCDSRFDGDDCSIDMTEPILIQNTSSVNNICDIKTDESCFDIVLLLSRTSTKLVLNYQLSVQKMDGSIKYVQSGNSELLFDADDIVYGQLETPKTLQSGLLSVYFYTISVKDIAQSNSISFMILNSDCHYCSSSTNRCQLKSGKCDINGKCYSDGEPNAEYPGKICNSKLNPYAWSNFF